MTTNSLDEMYKWLAVEPRTRGWNAILAYDRTKTNTVLLQEYISRFGTNDYLEPITELLEDNQVPTQRDYVVDYVLDAPRLSFVNSSLENSMAHSCQKIMGGTRLTFERPLGATEWKVIKVANWKPVNGPTLEYDIELKATQGTVDKLGTVSLNIAEGRNYRMTYEDTEHLAKFVGERFKARFARLPEPKKTFVLNEITIDKDQLLKPKNFVIRTHNKAGSGATLAANETKEEGAVLLFVTMEGQSDGVLPALNRDLRYLLPDGISATLILGHVFFYDAVMVASAKKFLNSEHFTYKYVMSPDGKTIDHADVTLGGRAVRKNYSKVIDNFTYSSESFNFTVPGLGVGDYFKVNYNSGMIPSSYGKVYVEWITFEDFFYLDVRRSNGESFSEKVPVKLFHGAACDIVIDPGTREFALAHKWGSGGGSYPDLSKFTRIPQAHKPIMEEELRLRWLHDFFETAVRDFTSSSGRALNILALHSLLFRGKNQIQLQEVNFKHDFAVFGQVGPTLTAFTLNELEPVVGRDDTFEFKTVPAINNVTWSVENISGDTGATGSIDQKGKYTAPNAGQFPGDYTRVRVKATAGGNSSSALVSVLRYDISINPLVQIVGAGDSGGREVSAGALGGAVLQWSMADRSKGGRVEPSLKEGGDHTYYPGPPVPGEVFVKDEIIVTNPHTKKTETSTVVVLHGQPTLRVIIVPGSGGPANQVQLDVTFGSGAPIPPPSFGEWSMFAGSGRVDANTGLFTVDPLGVHKFAVVLVEVAAPFPDWPSQWGYIILPIPLYSVPEALKILDAVETAQRTDI